MKIKLIALALALPFTVNAEVYVDIGIAYAESDYVYNRISTPTGKHRPPQITNEYVEGVIGTIEVGYTKNDWTVYGLHQSLFTKRDGGLSSVGIKARVLKW